MSPPLGINTSTPQQFLDALQALNLNDIWTQPDTYRLADMRAMRLEVQHIAALIQGRENYIKKEAQEAKYHKYVDTIPLRLLLTLTRELDTNLRDTIKFFDWGLGATSARPFEFGTYIVGGDDYHGEYIIGSDVELDLFELKHKPSIPLSTLIQFKENAAQRGHEIRTALHELKERIPDLQNGLTQHGRSRFSRFCGGPLCCLRVLRQLLLSC